jgi:solute carrier family 25 folate transporter 32
VLRPLRFPSMMHKEKGKGQTTPPIVSPRVSSVIGVVAAFGSNFVLYPLDFIKVQLQAQAYREVLATSRFRALSAVIANTFKRAGLFGFYAGLTPGLIGPMAAWGSYMWFYKWGQQNPYIPKLLGLSEQGATANFIAGLQAGVGMTLVTNPIFVIKTRMQTSTSRTGFIRECVEVVRSEGIRGMYKGLVPALPLTLHAALHWTIYERFKQILLSFHPLAPDQAATTLPSLNATETLVAASGSKLVAAAITYPLHVMKTCMQTQRGLGGLGLTYMIKEIYRLNGWRGMYSGFIPHLLRTVPNATVTMFLIERLTQAYINYTQNKEINNAKQ